MRVLAGYARWMSIATMEHLRGDNLTTCDPSPPTCDAKCVATCTGALKYYGGSECIKVRHLHACSAAGSAIDREMYPPKGQLGAKQNPVLEMTVCAGDVSIVYMPVVAEADFEGRLLSFVTRTQNATLPDVLVGSYFRALSGQENIAAPWTNESEPLSPVLRGLAAIDLPLIWASLTSRNMARVPTAYHGQVGISSI